jgi:Na+/H+-dicarboxylate symporter
MIGLNCGVIGKISGFEQGTNHLNPLFEVSLARLASNDTALLLGGILGLFCIFSRQDIAHKVASSLNCVTKYFFKILLPIMPLFIIGTSLKLQHDGMLPIMCTKYLQVMILFIISAGGMIVLQFSAASGFKMKTTFSNIRNMVTPIVTGFGAMSSAAALPLSIKAAENNLNNRENAAIIIPSTVNVHLLGDCFFIPMMAIAIMVSFGMESPTFWQYFIFSLHFVMAKFAVAAVPGGGVLVMLPVMQNYLEFNAEMLGMITAVYVLFDPIITACNIAGNGAFAIIFDRIISLFERKK